MAIEDSRAARLTELVRSVRARLGSAGTLCVLPSLRARDYARVAHGISLPLGLVSTRFECGWQGGFHELIAPRVAVFDGELMGAHVSALLPHLEHTVRESSSLLLAAREFDPEVFSMLLLNHQKETLRVLPVLPTPEAAVGVLVGLATLAAARLGRVTPTQLDLGTRGALPGLIATADQLFILGEFPGASMPIGVVYVGGSDLAHARARVAAIPPEV